MRHAGPLDARPDLASTARRRIAAVAAALLVGALVTSMTVGSGDALAQDRASDEIERELEDAGEEAEELESDLGSVRSEIDDAEEELAAIGARLADARSRLRSADGQVALGELAVEDAEQEARDAEEEHERAIELLDAAEVELAEEEEVLAEQLVHTFKYGTAGAQRGAMTIEVLRRADDPNAFAVGMKQLQTVVDEQDTNVRRVFELRDEREELESEAGRARNRALEATDEAEHALTVLEDLREQAAAVAAEIEDDERSQEQILASLQTSASETEALFERVAARQVELEEDLNEQRAREEAERRAAEEAERRAAEEEARRRAEAARQAELEAEAQRQADAAAEAEAEAEREAQAEADRAAEAQRDDEREAQRDEEREAEREAERAAEREAERQAQREAERAAEQEEASSGTGGGNGGGNGGGVDRGGNGGGSDVGAGGGPSMSGIVCPVVGAAAGRDFSNDWGLPRSGGRFHQGNDIFASRGTPVVAVDDAVVTSWNPPSAPTNLGGITVTYRTADGSEWYNAHLDTVASGIEPGVSVARGDPIGTVGNTGNAITTPPHLHLGRRHGGGWVNPWPTISPVCS